jgi:TPP-dependent indolepyruvate ferredoxin oxidoreductase alpha subunit
MKNQNTKREFRIAIRINEEEKKVLNLKARNTAKSVSTFMRDVSLNYPVQSRVDQIALDQLIKTKADFGRVGGLFKMWLVANEEQQSSVTLDGIEYHRVQDIVNSLELFEKKLLNIAEKLL